MRGKILIADDDKDTCRYIYRNLMLEDELEIDADFAYQCNEAIKRIDAKPPYDLLIVDLWMPDKYGVLDKESGLKILKHGKERDPNTRAIVITGNTSSSTVIKATSMGAWDYVRKPIDYKQLAKKVKQALEEKIIEQETELVELPSSGDNDEIVFTSEKMLDVMKKVGRIAKTDVDVLICGESGTGKDMIVRTIHNNSQRKNGPLVAVNASAIPSELIESELFGIGKRVATEVDARQGKFLEANGGTIFLDEIGEFSMQLQPKLLRAIEYKEIQQVGMESKKVDVRIIAATNLDLKEAVERKNFRRDLYYRLNGFTISIPPLRERQDDIVLLANHFLKKYVEEFEWKKIYGFTDETLSILREYRWPGNVRELQKAIEYAVVTCNGGLISPNDLPHELLSPLEDEEVKFDGDYTQLTQLEKLLKVDKLEDARKAFEKMFVEQKLIENRWVITKTAQQIGMARPSLHRKMDDLGIEREED